MIKAILENRETIEENIANDIKNGITVNKEERYKNLEKWNYYLFLENDGTIIISETKEGEILSFSDKELNNIIKRIKTN